jgi:hypothetical protein
MDKGSARAGLLMPVLAIVLSLYALFVRQAPRFTIDAHAFRFETGPFLGQAFILLVFLVILWQGYARGAAALLRLAPRDVLAGDATTYLPLLLLGLVPLASRRYIDAADLTERAWLFGLAALAAVLYLKGVRSVRTRAGAGAAVEAWRRRIDALSVKKRVVLLFAAALLVMNLGSLKLLREGNTFKGDEPHYLLIAHSLVVDGDFDLVNNYANRDFEAYMPTGLRLDRHVVPGAKPDSRYSFHSPGTALILAPFYALGRLFGAIGIQLFIRLGMSLFGALFGVQIYLFARKEWGRETLALGLWALVTFSTPVFFYSLHAYPELVVGLGALIVLRLFRHRRPLPLGTILACGLILSAFIWFHALKYIVLAVPFIGYGILSLARERRGAKAFAAFLAFPLLVTGLYFVFQKALYGSYSLSTVSWRGSLGADESLSFAQFLLTGIPFRARWETLAGYFLDQRDGLLLYAPVYLFALLGVVDMIRRRSRWPLVLAFLAGPYVFVSAFLTQRGGYAPQARPLVSVIWAMAIPLGFFLAHNARPLLRRLFNLAAGVGLFFVWLLLSNPFFLYQETTQGAIERGGGIFYLLSNLHFRLPSLLPSFLKVEGRWLPNAAWIGGLALLLIACAFIKPGKAGGRRRLSFACHAGMASAALLLVFVWIILYPRLILYNPVRVDFPGQGRLIFYSLSRVARMQEPGRFALLEDNRSYTFSFVAPRPIRELGLEVGSEAGDYRSRLVLFDKTVFEGETRREFKTASVPAPPSYRLGPGFLYRVTIELERRSDVDTGLHPFRLALRPVI